MWKKVNSWILINNHFLWILINKQIWRFKGPLPTLMHCAPRTQIPRISCYMNLLIVWKAFLKIWYLFERLRLSIKKKKCHPFEQLWLSVRKKKYHPFKRLRLSIWEKLSSVPTLWAIRWIKKCHSFEWLRLIPSRKTVIRSNGSGYPFKTIASLATIANHFHPIRARSNLSKHHVHWIIPLSVVYHHRMNFHGTFSTE